jgi:hypothetical protein
MLIKIAGRVRGFFAGNYPENREDEQFHLNTRGDQIVAQGLPELTEIVRLGDSWQVMTATAIAPLTAIPTTTGGLQLWNGESGGGKSYVVDSVGMVDVVVDATQANQSALFACLVRPPVAAPTDAALVIRSLSGRNAYAGRARTTVNAAVTNDSWFPVGTSAPVAAAAAGSAWKTSDYGLRGLYIIPPGGMLALHAAKVAATASQVQFFIRWHEVQLIVKS